MTLEMIKKDLASSNIPPIYLWYGEDRFSLTEALKVLKEFFCAEDPSGSGIELFSGKDVSLERVVEAANTSSFFARRLVIVDDIPYFNQGKGQGNADEDPGGEDGEDAGKGEGSNTDILVEYCQNVNPETCLLLISLKVHRGRRLFKEIGKVGKVFEFTYPKGHTAWLAWIQKEARAKGKSIDPHTAGFLLEWAGHHIGILSQEIDKLSIYTGNAQEITREDISKICIPLVETTVFAMLDAIASGNTGEALRKLEEVLSQEHQLKVHTMIVRQTRLLLAGSLWRKRGGTVEKLMETAGIKSPFEGNKIFRQAAGFTPEKLAIAMEDCLQTEIALKSSGGNPHLLLETMVIRFCQR